MVAAKANEATNSVIGIPNTLATVPHITLPTTKPPFSTSRYTANTLAPIHFGADFIPIV